MYMHNRWARDQGTVRLTVDMVLLRSFTVGGVLSENQVVARFGRALRSQNLPVALYAFATGT